MKGTINPAEFTVSTTELVHTSTHKYANSVAKDGAKAIKYCFNEYIDDLLKEWGMTYSDLGFSRYD